MFSFIKKIVFTVVAVALLLVIFQNMEPLSQSIAFGVDLYAEGFSYNSPEFPVFFIVFGAFLLGTMITGLHGIYERIARKAEIRLRDRKIKALEKELSGLKAELVETQKPVGVLASAKADKPASGTSASAIIKSKQSEPVVVAPTVIKPVAETPALTPLEEEPTL